jgi:hypothetical protein
MNSILTLRGIIARAALYREHKLSLDKVRIGHLVSFELDVMMRLWAEGEVTRKLGVPNFQPLWLGSPVPSAWLPYKETMRDTISRRNAFYWFRLPGIWCATSLRTPEGDYYDVVNLGNVLAAQCNIVEANSDLGVADLP